MATRQHYGRKVSRGASRNRWLYGHSPQAPLGGPDDRKDILATRDGVTCLAAVYFPPTPKNFSEIKNKYTHDREYIESHGCGRFVFLVNQNLTLGERTSLKEAGAESDEIYDLQRIATILDSPPGYGIRLSYLRIQMTTEEQISFFSALQNQTLLRREASKQEERPLLEKIAGRTLDLLDNIREIVESSVGNDVVGNVTAPIGDLSLANLLLVHSAVIGGSSMAPEVRGAFRNIPVWIANGNGQKLSDVTTPEAIVPELKESLSWWRSEYKDLAANPIQDAVVSALAEFHWRLAKIHPFVDGNGRVIRFILNKAAEELLHRGIDKRLTQDPKLYYEALSAASEGDLGKLRLLISAALL